MLRGVTGWLVCGCGCGCGCGRECSVLWRAPPTFRAARGPGLVHWQGSLGARITQQWLTGSPLGYRKVIRSGGSQRRGAGAKRFGGWVSLVEKGGCLSGDRKVRHRSKLERLFNRGFGDHGRQQTGWRQSRPTRTSWVSRGAGLSWGPRPWLVRLIRKPGSLSPKVAGTQ
jgi:hypothetical protein